MMDFIIPKLKTAQEKLIFHIETLKILMIDTSKCLLAYFLRENAQFKVES